MRNIQEQVKKAFCYQKLLWPFTVWINCSGDLKNFANSWPSTLNFNSFSRLLEHFFLTVGQKNFGNKISNFYDLLLEKVFLVIEKTFEMRGWRPRIRKKFEITRTIYSNSERSEKFLVTECFFNLFLEVSYI